MGDRSCHSMLRRRRCSAFGSRRSSRIRWDPSRAKSSSRSRCSAEPPGMRRPCGSRTAAGRSCGPRWRRRAPSPSVTRSPQPRRRQRGAGHKRKRSVPAPPCERKKAAQSTLDHARRSTTLAARPRSTHHVVVAAACVRVVRVRLGAVDELPLRLRRRCSSGLSSIDRGADIPRLSIRLV